MTWPDLALCLVVLLLVGGACVRVWVDNRRVDAGRGSPAVEPSQGPSPELAALQQIVQALQVSRGRRPEASVVIRLMSGSGTRELGRQTVAVGRRLPAVTAWVPEDQTLSTFVASHREGDAWVYRRVGVERIQ